MTARHENANAAPWARGGAAAKVEDKDTSKHQDKPGELRPQGGIQSWAELDAFTDRLTTVADRKDHLLSEIRWEQLQLEMRGGFGFDPHNRGALDELVAEFERYKAVALALGGRRAI